MQSMKEKIREIREATDREFEEAMKSFPDAPDIDKAFEGLATAKKIGAPLQMKIPKRFISRSEMEQALMDILKPRIN